MAQLLELVFSVLLSFILAISHTLLKSSAIHSFLSIKWFAFVFSSMLLYFAVFIMYSILLKHFELSKLYPLYTALSVILVMLSGVYFFGEELSPFKIIGAVSLIFSIFVMSLS